MSLTYESKFKTIYLHYYHNTKYVFGKLFLYTHFMFFSIELNRETIQNSKKFYYTFTKPQYIYTRMARDIEVRCKKWMY